MGTTPTMTVSHFQTHKKLYYYKLMSLGRNTVNQTLAQVLDHVSKHQGRKLKNEAQPSLSTKD